MPSTKLVFRERPGCRERHLRRKQNNPLFPEDQRHPTQDDVLDAQRRDNQELTEFMVEVRQLIARITELDPNVDSDTILNFKTRTDRLYEQCTGLPGDQTQIKQALIRLIDVLMDAIAGAAAEDPEAVRKLDQERQARAQHFELLESPLTGDLLREQSPVEASELVPTLLSEPLESLATILELFDREQLRWIRDTASALIAQRRSEGFDLPEAEEHLRRIELRLRRYSDESDGR